MDKGNIPIARWRAKPEAVRLSRIVVLVIVVSMLLGASTASMLGPSGDPVPQDIDCTGPVAPRPLAPAGVAVPDPARLGCYFTENLGQRGAGAGRFYAHGDLVSVALGAGWASYLLREEAGPSGALVRVAFEGCEPVEPVGERELGHRSNYFIGDDPSSWRSDARHFTRVAYRGLYEGIDLAFELRDGILKYEFTVRPGSDPGRIALLVSGAEGLEVDGVTGDLLVRTSAGTLRDAAPVSYELLGGDRVGVPTGYRLVGRDRVSFEVGGIDPAATLVIDPWFRFSTLLGSGGDDDANAVCVDSSGHPYVTGATRGDDFPTTPGALDGTFGPTGDAYVTKLEADGSGLVYSTYIGGGGFDEAFDIRVDGRGCAYVTGRTTGDDFPTTPGALDSTPEGKDDAFVLKLSPSGGALEYSTLVCSDSFDHGIALAVDAGGYAYVTGFTGNQTFPTTAGAFDTEYNSIDYYSFDAYVLKLNPTGTGLVYSTFLGSSAREEGHGIAVDDQGCAYVTGITQSNRFPTTPGAFNATSSGVFVAKLDPTGSHLVYSTFIGDGEGEDICIDGAGNAYVTGVTQSETFPITAQALDKAKGAHSDREGFVAKLGPDGSDLAFSTFLGGGRDDEPTRICLDGEGGILVTGRTMSGDFPLIKGAYDTTLAGSSDVFLSRISGDASRLLYSTLIGGAEYDWGEGMAIDGAGDVFLAGRTQSTEFPTTTGAYDASHNGGYDVFLLKVYDLAVPEVIDDLTPSSATTGEPLTFSARWMDDTGVTDASVEFWFGASGEHAWLPLALSYGDPKDGTWQATMTVPVDSVAPVHYVLFANDTADHSVSSDRRSVTVLDNDAPALSLVPAGAPSTGDALNVTVTVAENIGMREARIVYWFGEGEPVNASMAEWGGAGDGSRNYSYEVPVPSHSLEPLSLHVLAWDLANNTNRTATITHEVLDNDAPAITADLSEGRATTGEPFSFAAEVLDNIAVAGVEVEYWFGEGGHMTMAMEMAESHGGGNGTYSLGIAVPVGSVDALHYVLRATDATGNANSSLPRSVTVVDNDPPAIGQDLTNITVLKGGTLVLLLEATDNVAVGDVSAKVYLPGGKEMTVELAGGPAYRGEVGIPRDVGGDVGYEFLVVDTSGNNRSTARRAVTAYNAPPAFEDDIAWEITEEVDSTLDLSTLLSDPNDPLDGLTIGCGDSCMTLDGHLLRAKFMEWVPGFDVEVWASDGEATSYANITIAVLPVNDPPRILTMLPANGSSYEEGGAIAFMANATDVDGDDLTYRWYSGEKLLGEGKELRYKRLGAGSHTIRLNVSDGELSSEAQMVLEVTEAPSSAPWALLVVAIVAIVAIAGLLLVWRRRGRKGHGEGPADQG